MRKTIHQGDVVLEPIEKIPNKAKFLRKNIIAYGEITGHMHEVDEADIYKQDGVLYMRSNKRVPMIHPEHPKTEEVGLGDYRVRIQKEYFPDGSRQVKD